MAILSNIGAALFFIAFILLILCIISFFKKNGKAKQYGRPTVILFMISILLIGMGTTKSEHPVIDFFATLSLILFIFFLVLAILSVIKKTGVAKKQFIITAILFVIFGALSSISAPSSEKTTATNKQVASNNAEKKDDKKKEADEKTQKQEDEKRLADEQARKQQEEQKRQAEEQARKQQEEQKRQTEEQTRKQQEEQKRQAEEQARKQQEEQKRQADEQARKQQEEQKRQADEQARKQQEEQKKAQQAQTQPAASNNSNVTYANCAAVRSAGKAPLYRDQPGYSSKLDGDGVACEK
ncbi:excalibur calcium-binding domain-containing protein [Bacillus cereus group sp. N6]|uniref:excalibur calcium-binding domain-containing protein n=1 Tax=Bacillus cereus group sp. N6 TaxID=2794583 RepID=UPI0018F35CC8|nr:excalibur calcium-binding domain-containing protein [Bacillus cereus group sp. N6]MBJ8110753.1 excalibur calcium-binding domain-containing protein [Bacillus cereus group sp. N6]